MSKFLPVRYTHELGSGTFKDYDHKQSWGESPDERKAITDFVGELDQWLYLTRELRSSEKPTSECLVAKLTTITQMAMRRLIFMAVASPVRFPDQPLSILFLFPYISKLKTADATTRHLVVTVRKHEPTLVELCDPNLLSALHRITIVTPTKVITSSGPLRWVDNRFEVVT